jgi:predicted dehydrogenase
VVAILTFADGTLGRCTVSYGTAGPQARLFNLAAYGTRASIVRDRLLIRGLDRRETQLPVEYEDSYQYGRHQYWAEIADLVAAIRERRPPATTVRDGASAVAVALAIEEALVTRGPVRVDQPPGADGPADVPENVNPRRAIV